LKVGEAVNRVQSLYNRGAKPSSSRLTDRHAYNLIKTGRALAIKDSRYQGQWAYMPIGCTRIMKVSAAECGCSPSFGVSFFRSKYKIPTPLKADAYFMSVLSVDNSVEFSQTTWEAARYNSSSRFAKKVPQWYIKDGYLFVISPSNIGTLVLNAVWFDPVAAAMYNYEETGSCVIAQEVDLGIDSDLWERTFAHAKEELVMFVQMEEDGTQDSKDKPGK